tara:strand:- start:301 stop:405 length:105 start_codon:yes stop_codon:yes gene_type:complete
MQAKAAGQSVAAQRGWNHAGGPAMLAMEEYQQRR